jgi:copper chaperone CopZ
VEEVVAEEVVEVQVAGLLQAEDVDVEVKMKKTYKIEGMHCTSCSKLIEMELEDKVNKIEVDYEKGTAKIDFNEKEISEQEIKNIIKKQGFEMKGGHD